MGYPLNFGLLGFINHFSGISEYTCQLIKRMIKKKDEDSMENHPKE